jgi:hypothetical protein
VPRGTMKLKRKEFTDLKQGGMTVNEYLNSFIQLSRYAPDDINMDEKKQDVFLNGLNDDIQFQLLNTDYADFQHMVDKAIVVENKIREMEKDGKRKVSFSGQSSRSNVRHRFSQPNQFFKPPQMNRMQMPMQMQRPHFRCNGRSTRCRSQMLRCSKHHSSQTARAYRCSPDRTRNWYPAPQRNLRMVRRTKEVNVWGHVSSVA